MRFALVALALVAGCKQEPTIVITFAPQDMAHPADLARPADLATAPPDLAPAGDPCKADGDCVLIQEGCCSCNEGGRKIAVAKLGAKKREALIQVQCGGGVLCPQVMSEDASCHGGKAACIAGRCGVKPKK